MTLLWLVIGNVSAQMPTSYWADNADTQWYNAQDTEFTLSTSAELTGLSVIVANGNDFTGKTIYIDSDLDLGAHLWKPIGVNNNVPFSGTVDGKGHVISNLYVDMPTEDYVGLFGRCIYATLLNINIENATIKGVDSAGSLVGNLWKSGIIENCHATGVDIQSTGYNVGGLVGDILEGSSVYRCSSEGRVRGYAQVGGLLGSPFDGNSIIECFSAGTVHATYIAGGFIGASVPGFPGTAENTINNCYSRATVSVDSGRVGGFCGDFVSLLRVSNSYSTGKAVGPELDGGFVGAAGSLITENNYWDVDSSQHMNAIGGWLGAPAMFNITPKTTVEMKTAAMVDALNQGSGPWTIDPNVNDGYPSFTPGFAALPTEEKPTVALKVYPNVFVSELQIESDARLKSYRVYEISGKIVQEGVLDGNHAKIAMQSINSGVYMLLVKTDQGTISKKIVKQ